MDTYEGDKAAVATRVSGDVFLTDFVAMPSRWRQPPKPALAEIRASLEREGFAFGKGADVRAALNLDHDHVAAIAAAGRQAPPDPQDARRSRFYSQLLWQPWSRSGMWIAPRQDGPDGAPYTTYLQAVGINQEFGGVERRFAPLPPTVRQNPALHTLIDACCNAIPTWRIGMSDRDLVIVGVHLVRMQAVGHKAAIASPPFLHVDGELVTFVWLVERTYNCVGGISYVASRPSAGKYPDDIRPEEMIATGTLSDPLDVAVIDDASVSHTVSGVRSSDGLPAHRTAMFIDLCPVSLVKTAAPQA